MFGQKTTILQLTTIFTLWPGQIKNIVRNLRVRISIVGKMIGLPFLEIIILFWGSKATASSLGLIRNSCFTAIPCCRGYSRWSCQQILCLLLLILVIRLLFLFERLAIIDLQRSEGWFLSQTCIPLIVLCLLCCNGCLALGQVRPIIILHEHSWLSLFCVFSGRVCAFVYWTLTSWLKLNLTDWYWNFDKL